MRLAVSLFAIVLGMAAAQTPAPSGVLSSLSLGTAGRSGGPIELRLGPGDTSTSARLSLFNAGAVTVTGVTVSGEFLPCPGSYAGLGTGVVEVLEWETGLPVVRRDFTVSGREEPLRLRVSGVPADVDEACAVLWADAGGLSSPLADLRVTRAPTLEVVSGDASIDLTTDHGTFAWSALLRKRGQLSWDDVEVAVLQPLAGSAQARVHAQLSDENGSFGRLSLTGSAPIPGRFEAGSVIIKWPDGELAVPLSVERPALGAVRVFPETVALQGNYREATVPELFVDQPRAVPHGTAVPVLRVVDDGRRTGTAVRARLVSCVSAADSACRQLRLGSLTPGEYEVVIAGAETDDPTVVTVYYRHAWGWALLAITVGALVSYLLRRWLAMGRAATVARVRVAALAKQIDNALKHKGRDDLDETARMAFLRRLSRVLSVLTVQPELDVDPELIEVQSHYDHYLGVRFVIDRSLDSISDSTTKRKLKAAQRVLRRDAKGALDRDDLGRLPSLRERADKLGIQIDDEFRKQPLEQGTETMVAVTERRRSEVDLDPRHWLRRLHWNDFLVTVLVAAITGILGLNALWANDLTFGDPIDYFLALLFGFGLHEINKVALPAAVQRLGLPYFPTSKQGP